MRKKNLLYAEDNPDLRELFLTYSEKYLPEVEVVEVCKDGFSLEKRLQKGLEEIDLVLTDNQMPGSDGSDIIKKYARLPNFDKIPFILYYGGFEEIGKQAVRDGAFAYFKKPGHYPELIELVKKALKIE